MKRIDESAKTSAWHLNITDEPGRPVDSACVAVCENHEPEAVLRLATDFHLTHICQKNGFEFDSEIRSANVLVESPDVFREFPLASILQPTALNAASERDLIRVEEVFDSSMRKRAVLQSLIKGLESEAISQTMIDDISAVADELFTNAVYNAPFVDLATHLNPGISRHDVDIKYDGRRQGRLFLARRDSRLLIGCEDPFGSLDLMRYLNKIKDAYLRGPTATMNFGPGGAGLGSYIIFNSGSSLYFGVWPGQATILCAVIPLGLSNRRRVQLPKHLHWIQR